MAIARGDLVTIAVGGDYGKPRPALVVQADAFRALDSVTILRLTTALRDWPLFRISVEPDEGNGLRKPSQVMVDKAAAVPKSRIDRHLGQLDETTMAAVDEALARFLGVA